MSEIVGGRSLRGLGNALFLSGDREAPPGIELGIPAQTVHDLTAYARYGSAHVFGVSEDGWASFVARVAPNATFSSSTVGNWRTEIETVFDVSPGKLERMALWIYGISVTATAAVAIGDIGVSNFTIEIGQMAAHNSPTSIEHILWACDGSAGQRVLHTGALATILVNQLRPAFPFQWPAFRSGRFRAQSNANIVTFTFNLLCRMLPMGQAPLP